MPFLNLEWTVVSKPMFEELRERANREGRNAEFIQVHNEVVTTLQDLDQAVEKGEPLFKTRRPGGEVRHWVYRFISISYVVFPDEQVGFILRYQSFPESWPNS